MDRLSKAYERIFSLKEIKNQQILQWAFGASLFYFFVTFSYWIGKTNITINAATTGKAVCWPYFQSCTKLYFLQSLPYGYSENAFYMLLYGLMLLIVYFMWNKEWAWAHGLLCLLWLWKVFAMFVLSYDIAGPYDYYHVFLTSVILFVPYKEYFLKVMFVFLYFMSVTIKFSPSWILGSYFTSLQTGLPFVPTSLVPLATNIVIFSQMVECWFLLSRRWLLQRISFVYAIFFHLYSGILVSYNYPSVTLPMIAVLYGPLYTHTPTPFTKKSLGGWILLILIALFQLLGFVISPDRFMTLEGNRYGMFMFESNHQCIATIKKYTKTPLSESAWSGFSCNGFYCETEEKTYEENGLGVIEQRYESADAWNRCDPYEWWAQLHTECSQSTSTQQIAFTFDHSINGGPFYRIVDLQNICNVTYEPFAHNSWISIPASSDIVGYPVKNDFH